MGVPGVDISLNCSDQPLLDDVWVKQAEDLYFLEWWVIAVLFSSNCFYLLVSLFPLSMLQILDNVTCARQMRDVITECFISTKHICVLDLPHRM